MSEAGAGTEVVAVTGHRPQHLDGDFSLSSPFWMWIAAHLDRCLVGAAHLRCGMAIGVDILAAERAWLLDLPYSAFVPFEGQAGNWPQSSRIRYARTLTRASRRILVHEGGYAAWKLHSRNLAMLTGTVGEASHGSASRLIAVWNGKQSGGTYQTVVKAEALGIEVVRIDPALAPSS